MPMADGRPTLDALRMRRVPHSRFFCLGGAFVCIGGKTRRSKKMLGRSTQRDGRRLRPPTKYVTVIPNQGLSKRRGLAHQTRQASHQLFPAKSVTRLR